MKLGRVQRGVLKALASHGTYPGGWAWQNHSMTVRTLDSLVRKGLAECEEDRRGVSLTGPPRVTRVYRITDKGRKAIV